jgi:hypothetical protein
MEHHSNFSVDYDIVIILLHVRILYRTTWAFAAATSRAATH